jgi:hypothetical protein
MRTQSFLQAMLPLLAIGCASSQGEQVRDARMEQTEEQAQANSDAIDRQSEARTDAIAQTGDAREEQVAQANQPGENATETLVGVSKDRAVYQSEAQGKLDKLAIRINAAQQKIAVLGGKAPVGLKDKLQTAAQEHNLLKRDVNGLSQTPASDWETATQRIEERMGILDDRINQLTDSIEDA